MFQNIENLKITNIKAGTSAHRTNFVESRKNNAFILRTHGETRHTFEGISLHMKKGDIIFLPKGASYTFETTSAEPSRYVAITFDGDISPAQPFVSPFEEFPDAEEYKNSLVDLWKYGGSTEHFKCYALFYSLLAYLKNVEEQTYAEKQSYKIILPAVEHLKKHLYDCDLKIENLPRLCGVSGTYFRKIFQSHFGQSPQKYVQTKRLAHAKAVMDTGLYDSITAISQSVRFNDPLYFSRAFRKKYGISPSQYVKN